MTYCFAEAKEKKPRGRIYLFMSRDAAGQPDQPLVHRPHPPPKDDCDWISYEHVALDLSFLLVNSGPAPPGLLLPLPGPGPAPLALPGNLSRRRRSGW